jgi:hypothetical protein
LANGNFHHPPLRSPEFGLNLQEIELKDLGFEGFCSLLPASCFLLPAPRPPVFGLNLQEIELRNRGILFTAHCPPSSFRLFENRILVITLPVFDRNLRNLVQNIAKNQ